MAAGLFDAVRAYLNMIVYSQNGQAALEEVSPDKPIASNVYRRTLLEELRIISKLKSLTNEEKTQMAVHELDSIVTTMQECYAAVLAEYVSVKSYLKS